MYYFVPKTDKTCVVKKFKIALYNKKVKAIAYLPKKLQDNAPCLIYYHGGGFVLPAAPHHYKNAGQYCKGANCVVILVNYPLAPKHKYPKPIEASYDVYKWVIQNAKEFNIDINKIMVGGDSAGATIAATICYMANERNYAMPCSQMLMYPAVGSNKETASMKEFTDTPMINSKDYKKYSMYFFKNENQMKTRKYTSPLNVKNCKIYPTTYLETAEFDCLRDQGKDFAQQLKKSGVNVTLNNTKGTMHGYDIAQKSPITKQNVKKRIDFLNKVFYS